MKDTCRIQVKDKVFTVDNEDFNLVSKYDWKLNSQQKHNFYAFTFCTTGKGKHKKVSMHRLVINCPDGVDVDHINGDTLDNRKCNLRMCTRQENLRNKKYTNNKTGYKGIYVVKYKYGTRWIAQIQHKRQHLRLGQFKDKIEAAKAYDEKAKELFGEFAFLNFN